MDFAVTGLSPEPFLELYGLSDEALEARHAKRFIADAKPGFPDRIELRDVEPGEPVILVNYMHQPGNTPFRSTHAIFVREGAEHACVAVNEVPQVLRARPISIRAFDVNHWMIDADLGEGTGVEGLIKRLLSNPSTAYLHAHFAKRGCYGARIERLTSRAPVPAPLLAAGLAP
jgi:hypothetical protein